MVYSIHKPKPGSPMGKICDVIIMESYRKLYRWRCLISVFINWHDSSFIAESHGREMKWIRLYATFVLIQENLLRIVRWHCPPDTGFEIQTLEILGRARYLSDTEAHHNTEFHEQMGKSRNIIVSFKPPRPGNEARTVAWKSSGANHYPRAPARHGRHTGFHKQINEVEVWRAEGFLVTASPNRPPPSLDPTLDRNSD